MQLWCGVRFSSSHLFIDILYLYIWNGRRAKEKTRLLARSKFMKEKKKIIHEFYYYYFFFCISGGHIEWGNWIRFSLGAGICMNDNDILSNSKGQRSLSGAISNRRHEDFSFTSILHWFAKFNGKSIWFGTIQRFDCDLHFSLWQLSKFPRLPILFPTTFGGELNSKYRQITSDKTMLPHQSHCQRSQRYMFKLKNRRHSWRAPIPDRSIWCAHLISILIKHISRLDFKCDLCITKRKTCLMLSWDHRSTFNVTPFQNHNFYSIRKHIKGWNRKNWRKKKRAKMFMFTFGSPRHKRCEVARNQFDGLWWDEHFFRLNKIKLTVGFTMISRFIDKKVISINQGKLDAQPRNRSGACKTLRRSPAKSSSRTEYDSIGRTHRPSIWLS